MKSTRTGQCSSSRGTKLQKQKQQLINSNSTQKSFSGPKHGHFQESEQEFLNVCLNRRTGVSVRQSTTVMQVAPCTVRIIYRVFIGLSRKQLDFTTSEPTSLTFTGPGIVSIFQ